MDRDLRRKQSFLLRLPLSTRERANEIAHEEGTSLNYFIGLAVAEKISRMERSSPPGKAELTTRYSQLRPPLAM
jgi:hypothetical protein